MADERTPTAQPMQPLGGSEPEVREVPTPASTEAIVRRRGLRLRGRTLREHVARGSLVNAAFMIGLSVLGLLRGFVLAAFLTREDYGTWGIVIVTLNTLSWLKQVGVGDKYVQQDEDDQELAFQKAFTIEVAVNLAFIVIVAAAVPVVAAIYGQPQVILPGLVILAVLPAGVLQIPLWTYYRRMEFVKQRSLLAVEPIVGFVCAVGLAIAGAGYWSLVIGMVIGAWAGAIAALVNAPYRLRLRWDHNTVRSYMSFSWPLFVVGLGSLAIAQGGLLTAEKFIGLGAAGAVTLAATISQFTQRVDGLITGALYPAVAAMKQRMDLLKESFVKSNRLALMWAMPFGVALSLFCADVVTFGISEEWRPAVILLQVYGLTAGIGHVGFNWDAYFRAIGNTRPLGIASLVAGAAFLAAAIPLTAAFGLAGFAAAVAVQTLAHLCCRAYYLARFFHGFGFLSHALRAVAPTVPAATAVLLLRLLESGPRRGYMVAFELLLYLAITFVATMVLERALLTEALGYLRGRGTPRAGQSSPSASGA